MIPDGLIEAASFNPTSLRFPNAWIGHLPFAAWVMQQVSPKIFVELGTHSGNSYFAFCQSVAEARLSTRCYAVDTWQGDEHAGQYGEEIFASVYAHNQANYSAFSRLLRMTFDDAASYFSDESIGLLHIDGLHTYEAVRHDFATWLPKLAPGAVVMFHDTNVRERNFGVWKLWEELQAHYPNNLEFVHSHGLGVLQLNNAPEEKKLAWLQPDYPGKETLKSYFAALGARQLERFDLNELKQYADSLNQALAERDEQIASLSQALAERDEQIASLSQAVTEREAAFMSIINSRSWRLTKPYRWVGRMLRGDIAGAAAPFKKLLSMKKDGQSPAAAASADIVVPDPIAPTHTVSVILPVYRGIDMTRRCIEAAMPGVLGMKDAVLLAINDASPEQGMQAMLESLVEIWPGRFEVLENPVNLGFVGTVNRGMAHLLSQDVVLLNSDVIVPDDWLRRLQVEAYSHPRIATVTPFSNNATVCSFPNFLEENPLAFNLDVHTIDAVFRLSHLPCVSAPTGVGFCMYIRRACLDQIGYLNSEKFGRGYGEENDLCQRAIKAGWLNILSPNMYVFHEGGVSFSTDKQALIDRAMGVLDSLHPNYHADVQAFIQRDPLRLARVERYLQLLAKLTLPKVLHVSHGLGGGVRQHIEELAGYLDQGAAHLVLEPQDGPNVISLSLRACKQTDKLLFNMPDDYARLRSLLEQVGICAVHYHHTYNLDPVLQNLSRDLHAITLLTAHDYFWLNANPTLTDVDGRFPGQYVDDLQNPLYPLPTGVTAAQWREKLRPLIEQADCVIFPSNATRALFGDMYRLKHDVVAPHVEPHLNVRQAPRPLVVKQHYVVGVLGAVGREKGADVLEKLAMMAHSQGARFSFKLIGYSYRQLSAVETTGPYKVENLMALIEQHEVDLILFPAQWPETYSYTLSHALASGLPIIAPNLGAFPERLSGRACATLFDHMEPVSELYRRIGDFIGALESGTTVCAPVFPGDKSQPEFYDRDYLPLLASALKPPGSGKLSFEFGESQIVRGPLNKTGWRSAALRGLWWLHTHPSLRWVSSAVPYNFKRTVKRWLSRSPMHDSII